MKLQYLGNAKDSFKWDYHDYLVTELGYDLLNIVLMMTLDDGGNDGKLNSSQFPARREIIDFCEELKKYRQIDLIKKLPKKTKKLYRVELHKGTIYISQNNANAKLLFDSVDENFNTPESTKKFISRDEYFSGFKNDFDQLILIDPDSGFEPKTFNKKHVRYKDISLILNQISKNSVISVFQNLRMKKFVDDYACITKRIESGYSCAIYWHSLMFVVISPSEAVIKKVTLANAKYAQSNPVKTIPSE